MKAKRLHVMTFMSWDNEYEGQTVRATALCSPSGYFDVAINCVRDSDMGERGTDLVYERKWYADYIDTSAYENLMPSTKEEVEMYLRHVDLEDAVGNTYNDDFEVRIVNLERGRYFSAVITEIVERPWWKKLLIR